MTEIKAKLKTREYVRCEYKDVRECPYYECCWRRWILDCFWFNEHASECIRPAVKRALKAGAK